jgi:CheY-like chemotaxis protein
MAPSDSATPLGPAVDTATVLVVDDEDDIRFLARLHLERVPGFQVVGEATDGVESIELASALQPDIVLLDVMMPRMDGPTALPELQRVCPRSMVVMVSALAAALHEQEAIAAGAFGYVEKGDLTGEFPTRLGELYDRFRRALDGQTVWAPERPPGPISAPATP